MAEMYPHILEAMQDELLKIAAVKREEAKLEMQKEALLGLGVLGGLHVAGNAMNMSAGKNTNLHELLAHKAMEHAITGAKINKGALATLHKVIGPESMTAYHVASGLAEKMKDMGPSQRQAMLQMLSTSAEHMPEMAQHSHLIDAVQKAARHQLEGTKPEFQITHGPGGFGSLYARMVNRLSNVTDNQFDSAGRRIGRTMVAGAGVPALAAATYWDPWALAHGGLNTFREGAAGMDLLGRAGKDKSETWKLPGAGRLGSWMGAKSFKQGLEGRDTNPLQRKILSYGVSPGLYEMEDVGKALRASGQAPRVQAAMDRAPQIMKHLQGMGIMDAPGNRFEQAARNFKGAVPKIEMPRIPVPQSLQPAPNAQPA